MYIGEIAPREQRGMLVTVAQLNIVLGFSVAYFANYFVLLASQSDAAWVQTLGVDRNAWRWMLGIEAIPAAIWFLSLMLIPESPRWLVMKGRLEDARVVLARLKPPERVQADLDEIAVSLNGVKEKFFERMKEVVLPAMRLPMVIGLIAAIAQATMIGVINVVFTIIAMFLIDRLGRKPLLMIGLAGVIISTAVVGFEFQQARYELPESAVSRLSVNLDRAALQSVIGIEYTDDRAFKNTLREALGDQALREHSAELTGAAIEINPVLVLAGILGFVASFAISLGPVYWCLLSEIFPNRARGPAMALVGFFNAISSFMVQFVFPWELTNLGNAAIFFIYSALGLVAIVLLAWLLPETKGKSLEELEVILSGDC